MEGVLGIGLQLLVLGMVTVFIVLYFLMIVISVMAKIINISQKTKANPVGGNADEEELAVIMAALNVVNPGIEMANVRLKLIQ